MAAAQSQPGGKALPMFVSQWAATAEEHVLLASRVGPFGDALDKAYPPRFKHVAHRCASDAGEVVKQRERALVVFREVSDALDRSRAPRARGLPEGSPARELNLPLIHLLVKAFG